MSVKHSLRGLYAITQDGLCDTALLEKTEAILCGGASILQYRDKSEDPERRQRQSQALKQLCQRYQCLFIINDDIELAHEIGADGVHLGQDDQDYQLARQRLGEQAIIGLSCYNQLSLAQQAREIGASYAAFGAFFPSPTKPNARKADIQLLRQAQEYQIPLCGIGGVTLNNAPALLEAGADMLAMISELYDNQHPEQLSRDIAALFA